MSKIITPEGAYHTEINKHSFLLEAPDFYGIQRLLAEPGHRKQDVLMELLGQNLISKPELRAAGTMMLQKGEITSQSGKVRPISTRETGRILSRLIPRSIHMSYEPPLQYLLNEVQSTEFQVPVQVQQELRKTVEEAQKKEMTARIFLLLAQGHISLYPYDKAVQPPIEARRTGEEFIRALSEIPSFKADFDKWCTILLSIPTTEGASLPHLFSFLLDKLGLELADFPVLVKELHKAYEEKPQLIREIFERSITNTGTGDRYSELDARTLPLIYDKIGKHPGWVEMTVSKGVVIAGTLARMRSMGMTPSSWMAVDLHTPEELWNVFKGFYHIYDDKDPWSLIPGKEADKEEALQRVRDTFSEMTKYIGFLRADFEKAGLDVKIHEFWRRRSTTSFPDVVRMTGVIGVTAQSMENLIRTVNPNGGVIILAGQSGIESMHETMWQVFRDRERTRLKLIEG